jgi:acyl carrier protein
MTEKEVYAELSRIFHKVFERDDLVLTPELTADDVPGWNSFMQVEIILEVQERFDIRLTSEDLDHLLNVGDLAHAILMKTALGR